MIFLVVWLAVAAIFASLAIAPFWTDRVIVGLMRKFDLFLFPESIRLAVSLQRDTADWRFSDRGAEHQSIGEVRGLSVGSLHVLVKFGNEHLDWTPNFLERRIIWDAVRTTRTRLIHEQLEKVLR